MLPPPCHFEKIATVSHFWLVFYIFLAAGLLINLDTASVRWVDDQQQEGGGSGGGNGGGDTLIMLCNHMDTTLTLYTPPTIITSYNYLSSK